MINRILIILVLCCGQFSLAQSDFFSEINVTKKFETKGTWHWSAVSSWRHAYTDVKWNRLELGGFAEYNMHPWSFYGGLGNYYTFDKEIKNSYEFRPYAGITLKTTTIERISFDQRFQAEWRNFISNNSEIDKSSLRLRYRIGFSVDLSKNQSEKPWSALTDMEWFILNNKEVGERYINSRRFRILVRKKLSDTKEISLGFRTEKFNRFLDSSNVTGNSILLGYTF